MSPAHVIVIGAGSTGAAIAHDLAQRGLRVTVLERGGVASETTGHNQAQLHSGARYCVTDPEAARECIDENRVLRRILPAGLELNEGLFVAVTDDQADYAPRFMDACAACGIPAEPLPVERARQLEPFLNPRTRLAIQIPDGVFDPYRLCLSFLATAQQNGARVLTFAQVVGVDAANRTVHVLDRLKGSTGVLHADLIVNAAGPWAGRVAALGGAHVDLEASAGAMVTVGARLCDAVLNLLQPPGDGDIIVPQRQTSILGTTAWTVDDPDHVEAPAGQVEEILSVAEQLVPAVRRAPIKGIMAAARPLVATPGRGGRSTTRGFACVDHGREGVEGMVSVVGGKTTTARGMAQAAADLVCAKLGIAAVCQTRETTLLSHRRFVSAGERQLE